ncbi:MAG TPA: hypothetical protein VF480_11835 [Verrucomicrobiae bacterium]|jgi:hypothetical protein
MPEPELFLLFVRPLNRAGIRYVVSGSVAAIFYGEPRLTHDVDFVVFLNANDVQRLVEAFPENDFYLPTKETMLAEMAREHHGHFNLIHRDTGFKADMYPTGRDELNAWAFRGKRSVEYEGESVTLASPEYVILRKLEYFREGHAEKHLRDIRAMLAVSGEQLDRAALDEWIQRRGLETEWRQVSAG